MYRLHVPSMCPLIVIDITFSYTFALGLRRVVEEMTSLIFIDSVYLYRLSYHATLDRYITILILSRNTTQMLKYCNLAIFMPIDGQNRLLYPFAHVHKILFFTMAPVVLSYSYYTSTSAVWNIMCERNNHIQHKGEARGLCVVIHTSASFHTALVGVY